MTEYYKEKLKQGTEFQDFVIDILIKELGLVLSVYTSKKYQWKHGENRQGIEIKFDNLYENTGNIYIETAEKTNKDNPKYIKSGIYRDDNTWLYLIGNYKIIYIFSKKMLKGLYSSNSYLRKIETPTSQGFLLEKTKVEKYCAKIIYPEEEQKPKELF